MNGEVLDQVDAAIIGAGVIGLAVGRALARRGLEVIVLEREAAIGTGISSRNSEVIHAGLYYPEGSLKARLCLEGRRLLYAFCESHGVAHRRCGKLVVATEASQLPALDALVDRAHGLGVDDVERLGAVDALAMEPNLRCVGAIWSPSTGIVDSHGLMLALQGDVEACGGAVALASPVRSVMCGHGRHVIHVGGAEPTTLRTRYVVNAAGLDAVAVAAGMNGPAPMTLPTAHRCKGSYFSLAGRAPFSRLIYPLPQAAGLGVHLTLDLAGQARFGPDVEWLESRDDEAIDYRVDPRRADAFYAEVRRYWPALPDDALRPAYSGVRPKIHAPHEPSRDFVVRGPADHGVAGLVNLFGIESPGLTSCLALADEVATRLGLADQA